MAVVITHLGDKHFDQHFLLVSHVPQGELHVARHELPTMLDFEAPLRSRTGAIERAMWPPPSRMRSLAKEIAELAGIACGVSVNRAKTVLFQTVPVLVKVINRILNLFYRVTRPLLDCLSVPLLGMSYVPGGCT